MVGLCDGVLLLLAERARQDGRWQDSFEKRFGKTLDGPSSPFGEGQFKNPSVWTETPKRRFFGYVLRAGEEVGQAT